MKELKKEVDITEDNYKGYVELYKYKEDPFSNQFYINEIKDVLKIIGLTFLTTFLATSVGILDNMLLTSLLILSFPVGSAFYLMKQMEIYEEININDLLNEYPNIENIDIDNLKKSLEKVGILKKIDDKYELDVKGYEIKLKGNKVIEESLKDKRYEYTYTDLTADYIVPEKEQEKVKTKVRKMHNK